jgi:hypothetical protein
MCGYPLQWSNSSIQYEETFTKTVEELVLGGICMQKRDECEEHRFWEQVRFNFIPFIRFTFQNVRFLLDSHRIRLIADLDTVNAEYERISKGYQFRGDALTLLTNYRVLSKDARAQEDAELLV